LEGGVAGASEANDDRAVAFNKGGDFRRAADVEQ
jgi:hypothetical protein